MTPEEYVKKLLPPNEKPHCHSATAFAPSNIALCKYWGKRDVLLNLPVNSSLSISLGNKGTTTTVTLSETSEHQLTVNQQPITNDKPMAKRLWRFVNYCMPDKKYPLHIASESNIPLAAGLASSASCFASLVLALNTFFGWQLTEKTLSLLARLGSGSACRSFWPGFVEWKRGDDPYGFDSYAYPLQIEWPELCIGLLLFSSTPKPYSSTEAMNITVETSPLYDTWPATVEKHMALIKKALQNKDFQLFGGTAEANALAMHHTMQAANPSIDYSLPETILYYEKIHQLRKEGVPVYFTQDAGPNLKILFERQWYQAIYEALGPMDVVELACPV